MQNRCLSLAFFVLLVLAHALFFKEKASAQSIKFFHFAVWTKKEISEYQGSTRKDIKVYHSDTDGAFLGNGFVIQVTPEFSLRPYRFEGLSYLYPSNQKYRAVYILTNSHVWSGGGPGGAETLSEFGNRLKHRSGLQAMVMSRVTILGSSGQTLMQRELLRSHTAYNLIDQEQIAIDYETQGLKVLNHCLSYRSVREFPEEGLRMRYGCDHALIRLLVPATDANGKSIDIPTFIANRSRSPSKGDRAILRIDHDQLNPQEIIDQVGSVLISTVPRREKGWRPNSGWSGSPLISKESNTALGLMFTGWPGRSWWVGSYSIKRLYEDYDFEKIIKLDQAEIQKSGTMAPIKGWFYYP